LPTLEEKIGP